MKKDNSETPDIPQTLDAFQAKARDCLYNQTPEIIDFITTTFGKELLKNSFFLTTQEVEGLFKITRDQQKTLRNRVNDPLPYHKERNCDKCKILYQTETLLKWLERNYPEVMV